MQIAGFWQNKNMSEPSEPILKLVTQAKSLDLKKAMAWVTATTGKTGLRQAMEIGRFALGKKKLSPQEYYHLGLWRPHLSADEKAAFLSASKSMALNRRLSPINATSLHGLMRSKILTGLILRAAGFPTMKPLATFGGGVVVPGAAVLRTAADIADWLRQDGLLPVFGKPVNAALSIGAASYIELTPDRTSVVLGNGKIVALAKITAEIAEHFATGYLFEPLIRQHPALEAIAGKAVGGLRVVTLRGPDGPEVLYTVQRLPGPGAMMDALTASPYSVALVDPATGRIVRAQSMFAMNVAPLEASLVTGVRFETVTLPFVSEAMAVSVEAHRLFATSGVLGFDIALTTTGVVINEVNSLPYHSAYQHSADRGLMNAEFRPRIEAAIRVAEAKTGKR